MLSAGDLSTTNQNPADWKAVIHDRIDVPGDSDLCLCQVTYQTGCLPLVITRSLVIKRTVHVRFTSMATLSTQILPKVLTRSPMNGK